MAIAGLIGFAEAKLVGQRVTAASRLLLAAVREVGSAGRYEPPDAALPVEFAALSEEWRPPMIVSPPPAPGSARSKPAAGIWSPG